MRIYEKGNDVYTLGNGVVGLMLMRVQVRELLRRVTCLVFLMCVLGSTAIAEDMPKVNEPIVVVLDQAMAVEAGIPVETQYATFYFPIENSDGLKFTLVEENGWTMMIAAAAIGEAETDLYFLTLGSVESDGLFFGALQDQEVWRIDIHVLLIDPVLDGFAEEDYDLIYTLQESMNLILDQLMEDPRYIAE